MPPHPFLVALQFLTRLPLRLSPAPSAAQQARALYWYPAVGGLLGAGLCLLALALQPAPAVVRAAVLLAVWVCATGLLHLDGLADCADAWLGGHGDRERTLAIMKDPASGPAAVVVLLLVLLLKFAALQALPRDATAALVAAPLLARATIPLLFATTPYLRRGGLGSALASSPHTGAALGVAAAVATLLLGAGPAPALAALVVFLAVRALARQRLGGFTGDVAGALVELAETAALLAALG